MTAGLILILAAASLRAAEPSCLDLVEVRVASRTAARNAEYRALTEGRGGVRPGNESRLYRGTKPEPAVLLLHGFIASPFEVRPVAAALHAAGYTVLTPLIDGFGGGAAVANALPSSRWRGAVDAAVEDLSLCHREIALIGFSLGGGLAADYALGRAEAPGRAKLTAVGLLSPYIQTSVPMSSVLNDLSRGLSPDDTVSFAFLKGAARLTGGENRDLDAPMKYAGFYTEAFPLMAVDRILRFSEELRGIPAERVSAVPAFLAYSESDQTIDWRAARDFSAHRFENLTMLTFSAEKKAAHQIALRDSGADVDKLNARLLEFLRRVGPPPVKTSGPE